MFPLHIGRRQEAAEEDPTQLELEIRPVTNRPPPTPHLLPPKTIGIAVRSVFDCRP